MSLVKPGRVLVPIDVPEIACDALDAALRLVGDPDELHVLHVVPAWEQEQAMNWGTIDGESREAYALRDLGQRLRDTRYRDARLHVVFGDPAPEIVAFAEQIGADLVVMSTHGRTGLSRVFSGSVAEKVIRTSSCPVLVLPARQPVA